MITLQDNERDTVSVANDRGPIGLINYEIIDGILVITHTEVGEEYRGRGYAELLVSTGIALAKVHDTVPGATCPYAAKYFKEHNIENNVQE